MNIKETIPNASLVEAGHGDREVRMAFINHKTGETITPFCKCKDYFNDMFFTHNTGDDVNIYGFKWSSGQQKELLNSPRLKMAVKTTLRKGAEEPIKEEERFSIMSLLNKFSKSLGLGVVNVVHSDDKKHLIVSLNKKWTDIPYLNSAFYFLLRMGFTYNPKEDFIEQYSKGMKKFISSNDYSYFNNQKVKERLLDLLAGKIDTKQNYRMYNNGTIHNNSGIVGYSGYKVQ